MNSPQFVRPREIFLAGTSGILVCRRKASTAPAVGLARRGRDHSSRSEGAHTVAADEAGSPASPDDDLKSSPPCRPRYVHKGLTYILGLRLPAKARRRGFARNAEYPAYTQRPERADAPRDAADSGAWPGSRHELPGAHRPEVLGLHRLHCEETIAGAVSKPTVQAVAHDDLVGLRDAAKTSSEVDRVADDADMCATEWPKAGPTSHSRVPRSSQIGRSRGRADQCASGSGLS